MKIFNYFNFKHELQKGSLCMAICASGYVVAKPYNSTTSIRAYKVKAGISVDLQNPGSKCKSLGSHLSVNLSTE